MKKKGFTLIELLAVIIILAVIALIATPIVLNVVEKSQEQARQASVAGYADAVKTTAYEYYLNNHIYPTSIDTSKVVNQGDKVYCENVLYSQDHGVVLNNCSVKEETNEKKYCFVQGKTYDDCNDEEFQKVYVEIGSTTVQGNPLKDELLKQYNDTNTVGLLKEDNIYYYKGTNEEVANNFVWWGGHLWRVLTINEDNSLTMITQQPLTSIQPASAVWTTQAEYEASYINTWLNEVFLGSMEEIDKAKVQENIFNIGGLYNSSVGIVENIDSVQTTQKVGLLDETQYTKVGGANSFLDIKDIWWLGNRYDSSRVRRLYSDGNLDYSSPSDQAYYGVRPVIKISNLTFTGGKGTLEDPYREASKTSNMAQVKVGEYISIPTSGSDCGEDNRCLFRVVSKDGHKIKVTLNGLLPSTSRTRIPYTSGSEIDTKVKVFAETIDSKYRYTGNDTTFGIGIYDKRANYTVVQNTKYTGTVGLPVVGEMFTSNDIDMSESTTKIFVNVATIENPTLSNYFWTMNAYSTSLGLNVVSNGNLYSYYTSSTYGVRPVLFLNSTADLTFASGEGTAESPFMLGE